MTGAKWNGQGPGVESQPFPLCREDLSFHQGGVGQWHLVSAQMDKKADSDLSSPLPSVSQILLPWRKSRQQSTEGSGFLEKTNRKACILQEVDHSNLALLREGVPGTHCGSLPQVGMS